MKRGRVRLGNTGEIRAVVEASGTYRFCVGGVFSPPTTHAVPRDATLVAPVQPGKVVCVGRNYAAHARELGNDVPTVPKLFLKPPSALIGPDAKIVRPLSSERVDFEGEIALVVGRRCRSVTADEALAYIYGVTGANDITARDLQRSDAAFTRGKGFDTFLALGPLIAPLDAVDLDTMGLRTRVNGTLRQVGALSDMVFSPAALVAFISDVMTLEPGDVILTGTPAGVGPLGAGDVVEIEVDGVGVLKNEVVDADA